MLSETLKERARAFRCKRNLGQNFLINAETLSKIAAVLELTAQDRVLEIGPGLGFLTEVLCQTGASVVAVELDSQCINAVNKLSLPHLNLIHEDFLQCNISSFLSQKTKVIGNVPYQITTPIIAKLLGEIGSPAPWLNSIQSIVLTVQKEVAKRLTAKVGEDDYSQISLLIQYFARSEYLFTVEAEDFFPKPEVTSAVVRLTPFAEPPVKCTDHTMLRQVVHAGFRQRRKMMKNNLTSLALDERTIMSIFSRLNFDPQARAERIGLNEFALLADEISLVKTITKEQSPAPK